MESHQTVYTIGTGQFNNGCQYAGGRAKNLMVGQSMNLGVSAVPICTEGLENSWRMLVLSLYWILMLVEDGNGRNSNNEGQIFSTPRSKGKITALIFPLTFLYLDHHQKLLPTL